jgi:hypothetical protein
VAVDFGGFIPASSITVDTNNQHWTARVAALRDQANTLISDGARPEALPAADAQASFGRMRREALSVLEAAVAAYGDLCPPGYPLLEDNGIEGAGGSVGVRFSAWHAFFLSLQNAPRPKNVELKPAGLAGALDVRVKRMPGDPLPPPDPNVRLELVVQSLRWDGERGWVEVRRVLPRAWNLGMVQDLFAAFLAGFNYDVAAGLPEGQPKR